jgi:hypothetical protein
MVVPISEGSYDYARDIRAKIRKLGVYVDADCSDRKMQKKVGRQCSSSVSLTWSHQDIRCHALLSTWLLLQECS